MEFNTSDFEHLLEMEEVTGFEEFLLSLNFSLENSNVTNESGLSGPDTIVIISLSLVAFILNIFAICGTSHIPNGLTTHSKLIISLAVSDILIVVSVFAHQLSKILHEPLNPFSATAEERTSLACSFAFISSMNVTAHLISLLNLFMMAVDHYLAITKPYQYSFLLNKRNGMIIVTTMWTAAIIGGFVNFFTGIGSYKNDNTLNYCEFIMYNDFQGDYLVIGCTFISLISITFMYLQIYFEVRKMNQRMTLLTINKEHNAKTLITTLLIIGTFTVCWIPLFTFQTVLLIQVHVNPQALLKTFKALLLANKYLYSLLLVNSIGDPIIYAVRLKEVQLGYRKFWKVICGKVNILQNLGEKKSSCFVRLFNRKKNPVSSDNESGERTISLMLDENGSDKDREQCCCEPDLENNSFL